MKKAPRMVLVTLTVFVFAAPACWAASVGVPASSEEHRLETTVEYSSIFDRDLKAPAQETDEISSSNQAHVRSSYAIFPWLVPYVKVGVADFEEELGNTNIAGLGLRNVDLDYDWGLSWGGGLGGTFPLGEDWFVGYDGQYLTSDNDLDSVTHSGRSGSNLSGEVSVQEWHAAAYVGKTFELADSKLTAYAGGRYSKLDFEIDNALQYDVNDPTAGLGTVTFTGDTDSDDNAGVFVGARWAHSSRWALSVEGRFIDETAVTGQVSYTF